MAGFHRIPHSVTFAYQVDPATGQAGPGTILVEGFDQPVTLTGLAGTNTYLSSTDAMTVGLPEDGEQTVSFDYQDHSFSGTLDLQTLSDTQMEGVLYVSSPTAGCGAAIGIRFNYTDAPMPGSPSTIPAGSY